MSNENSMIFYHGTSFDNWTSIQNEGVLWGKTTCWSEGVGWHESKRYTYLTPHIEIAREFGDILLAVEYTPIKDSTDDNYGFNPPEGETCWQFSVFVPILISNIRRI